LRRRSVKLFVGIVISRQAIPQRTQGPIVLYNKVENMNIC
jgi:hypothetical protein